MFDKDFWQEIFQSISKNRTRSLLSGFTVTFAILLFTILFGIANGLQNTFLENFADNTNNSILIFPGQTTIAHKGLQTGRKIQFKNEDFKYINEEFGNKIAYSSGLIYKDVAALYKNKHGNYNLMGVQSDYQFLKKIEIQNGRFITQNDLLNKNKVVIIGKKIENDLFLKTTSIGKQINLSGISYKVVGVFTYENGDYEENRIYTPVTTAQQLYGNTDHIDEINLSYNKALNYDEAMAFGNDIIRKLKNRFSIADSDQSAVWVRNRAEADKAVSQIGFGITVIILVIGFGTLIAGIVGVSNIMIFVVKERFKEIGIRKAIGASPNAIVSIILVESILITTIAGYLGLIVGVGVLKFATPFLKGYFIKDPGVSMGLVIGATITLIVAGGIAGYLPAKKAAEIKPIVALRND